MVTSIVPHNQALASTPFDLFHQPPLVPGTAGIALPKPGANAVLCIAPGNAIAPNDTDGQELTLNTGVPHLALSTTDTYPNQVFHRDYVIVDAVAPTNPLANTLREFWEAQGFNTDALRTAWLHYLAAFQKQPKWLEFVKGKVLAGDYFFLGKKEQPALVRGVIDLRLMTSEGPVLAEHGSVVAEHPDDPTNQWLIGYERFSQRYNWVKEPSSGLLIPTL